ncbi:MBL fold metallo-hydrolase [candidate division KSB1 bacterium]|nr:MBL fold metallo-hydrolase [candidate division KSB1 bacterium]
MMEKIAFLTMVALSLVVLLNCGAGGERNPKDHYKKANMSLENLTIIIIYDNNPYDSSLRTAWGFSCLIRFGGKNILFDTGGDSPTLLYNMEQLKIKPKEIDAVVLSHIHGDHVGGLSGFLKRNSGVTVYLPKSFPLSFKDEVRSFGAKVEEVHKSGELFDNVYSTGELGVWIKEQSLILKTPKGPVIITGCAHPGVVKIVNKSKRLVGGNPVLVMGGFHLGGTSEGEIRRIIADFKKLGVLQAGPSHCSGDRARQLFREAYRENFLELGVGRTITIGE